MEHQTNLLFNQDTCLPENPYSSPLEALRAWLGNFWMDRTEEEALEQWTTYVQESNLQARVLLKNLDVLCNDPPKNLPEILQDDGWIYLYDEQNWLPYSLSEHVEWLTQMTARWRRICEQEHASPAGVLRSVLQDFWIDRSDAMVLSEWKRYVKQAPRKAQIILQNLAAVIDAPPPDLPQLLQTYGWIYLYHDGNGTEPRAYSFSEHVEWLRQMTARFCAIYETQQCPSNQRWAHHADLVRINDSLHAAHPIAIAEDGQASDRGGVWQVRRA